MARKEFQIDWKGKSETIEYEDDLPFGEMEKILTKSVDLTDVTKPKVNLSNYRMSILLAVITKAPFPPHDPKAIRDIGRKTADKIMVEVMKDYPLAASLEGWMTSFLGSAILNDSEQIPMPSVHTPSDGTNQQSTDNHKNGSDKQSQQQDTSSKTQ